MEFLILKLPDSGTDISGPLWSCEPISNIETRMHYLLDCMKDYRSVRWHFVSLKMSQNVCSLHHPLMKHIPRKDEEHPKPYRKAIAWSLFFSICSLYRFPWRHDPDLLGFMVAILSDVQFPSVCCCCKPQHYTVIAQPSFQDWFIRTMGSGKG